MTKPTEIFAIDAPSPYNVILGYPGLKLMNAQVSTFHNQLSMMINGIIHIISGYIQQAQACFMKELSKVKTLKNAD